MSERSESMSYTPMEAVINAHPDISAGYVPTLQAGLSEWGKIKAYPYYYVNGNLSDGRAAVARLLITSPEHHHYGSFEGSKTQLILEGTILPSENIPEVTRKKKLKKNLIHLSFDESGSLVTKTEMGTGFHAIDPEELRFLALKGLTLLDTYERFASDYERYDALRLNKVAFETGPRIINAPSHTFQGMKEEFDKGIAAGIRELVLQFPNMQGGFPHIEDGKGQPRALRHVLSQVKIKARRNLQK